MTTLRAWGTICKMCVFSFLFLFFFILYDNYIYFLYVCIEQLYVHVHLLPNSDCKFDFI